MECQIYLYNNIYLLNPHLQLITSKLYVTKIICFNGCTFLFNEVYLIGREIN